jgi:transposase-like protein
LNLSRTLYYIWKKRDSLENKKPGPQNVPWALTRETILKVLELKRTFEEIATNYVIAVKAEISPSSVGKIWNEYFGPRKEKKRKRKAYKSVDWLEKHVCWALDTIKIPSRHGYMYAQLVIEEYSRCVLGWILSYSNTGEKSVMLLEKVIKEHGIVPLVVKTDRGSEFQNEILKSYLKEKEVILMASPGHYPLFNGKMERENQIFQKFLKAEKGVLFSAEEIHARLEKAIYMTNHELPRCIFNGKTSADVFKNGEIYKKEEKTILKEKVEAWISEIEKARIPRLDKLDVARKAVVQSVIDMGLCTIKSGDENVNQFAG